MPSTRTPPNRASERTRAQPRGLSEHAFCRTQPNTEHANTEHRTHRTQVTWTKARHRAQPRASLASPRTPWMLVRAAPFRDVLTLAAAFVTEEVVAARPRPDKRHPCSDSMPPVCRQNCRCAKKKTPARTARLPSSHRKLTPNHPKSSSNVKACRQGSKKGRTRASAPPGRRRGTARSRARAWPAPGPPGS